MRLIERLKERRIPAVHLVDAEGGAGFSQIGGLPHLPSDLTWPQWNGKSLSFIAQLDLAELPLGQSSLGGRLFFFYDQEQSTWGFDPMDRGSWRVLYSNETPPTEPTEPPADLDEGALFDPKCVQAQPIEVLPSAERLGLDVQEIPDEEFGEVEEWSEGSFQGLPRHQLLGYPDPVQNDTMELDSQLASHGLYLGDADAHEHPRFHKLAPGAADWRLLLQIDTDEEIGMMWGDCGMLYFFIRVEDLEAGNFDDVWMTLQCS